LAIRSYATFATNDAKVPTDIHEAGLTARDTAMPKLPPAPPPSLDVKTPVKGHGKIMVSAHETGPTRQQYVAQESADGLTWTQLGLGRGKMRTITGAIGTKVWVRMATIRGELQSDWCTPVLVTIFAKLARRLREAHDVVPHPVKKELEDLVCNEVRIQTRGEVRRRLADEPDDDTVPTSKPDPEQQLALCGKHCSS
jgi:hypothetical protein